MTYSCFSVDPSPHIFEIKKLNPVSWIVFSYLASLVLSFIHLMEVTPGVGKQSQGSNSGSWARRSWVHTPFLCSCLWCGINPSCLSLWSCPLGSLYVSDLVAVPSTWVCSVFPCEKELSFMVHLVRARCFQSVPSTICPPPLWPQGWIVLGKEERGK